MTDLELNEVKDRIKNTAYDIINKYGYEFFSEKIEQPEPSSQEDQEVKIQFLNKELSLRIHFNFSLSFIPLPKPDVYGKMCFVISMWDHVNEKKNGFFLNVFYRKYGHTQYVISRSLKDQSAEDYIDDSMNKFRLACEGVLNDYITGKRFEEHSLQEISGPEGWRSLQNALYGQESEKVFGKRTPLFTRMIQVLKRLFT